MLLRGWEGIFSLTQKKKSWILATPKKSMPKLSGKYPINKNTGRN